MLSSLQYSLLEYHWHTRDSGSLEESKRFILPPQWKKKSCHPDLNERPDNQCANPNQETFRFCQLFANDMLSRKEGINHLAVRAMIPRVTRHCCSHLPSVEVMRDSGMVGWTSSSGLEKNLNTELSGRDLAVRLRDRGQMFFFLFVFLMFNSRVCLNFYVWLTILVKKKQWINGHFEILI